MILKGMTLRAYCHATENPARVMAALAFASGMDAAAFTRTGTTGHYGNAIQVFEADLPHAVADALLLRLKEAGLGPSLLASLPERFDERGNLHIRLDKQEAFGGRLAVSSGDDVISGRGMPAAWGRREAVRVIERFLGEK